MLKQLRQTLHVAPDAALQDVCHQDRRVCTPQNRAQCLPWLHYMSAQPSCTMLSSCGRLWTVTYRSCALRLTALWPVQKRLVCNVK